MKKYIRYLLPLFLGFGLALGTGCSEDSDVNTKGAVAVSLQPSDAVVASAERYVVTVSRGSGAVTEKSLSTVTDPTVLRLNAGSYTISASAFAAGATDTPIATASADFKVREEQTAAVVLVLRGTEAPALSSITASNGVPKNQDVVLLTAEFSDSATGATVTWSDDCEGEFESAEGVQVNWSNNSAETCTITATATRDEGVSTAELELTTTWRTGTIVPVAGAYCSIYAGDTTWYHSVAVAPLEGEGGPAVEVGMAHVYGLEIGPDGNLYMAEREAGRVSMVNLTDGTIHRVVGTYAGSITTSNSYPMAATDPAMYWTTDVSFDRNDHLLVTSHWGSRVLRYYAAGATLDSFAGNPSGESLTEGAVADDVQLGDPFSSAVAPNGDVYIAERGQNRIVRVYADGHTIETFATNVAPGSMKSGPFHIDVDPAGNVYVAARFSHEILKYLPDGTRTVIAGTGEEGDGGSQTPATLTPLKHPFGIKFIGKGKVAFTDTFNHKVRIVGAGGNVKTVVGPGLNAIAGKPGLAETPVEFPVAVAVDADGNLYISQRERCQVVKVVGPF